MKQELFLSELKEVRCLADWHKRYYGKCARKYYRIDYWLKAAIGLVSLVGAGLIMFPEYRTAGAFISGGCALILTQILPLFKWDTIVKGFQKEEDEWTRVFKYCEDLLSFTEIGTLEEILSRDFQRIQEMRKVLALNGSQLPNLEEMKISTEKEVRKYYELDSQVE